MTPRVDPGAILATVVSPGRPVKLADLLPLVRWGDAVFSIDKRRDDRGITLRARVDVPDSRFEPPPKNAIVLWSEPRMTWTEGVLFGIPEEYPTLDEALFQFRAVARLLVLHEVDESLRFGERLWFDPHTKERERSFPPDEEWP